MIWSIEFAFSVLWFALALMCLAAFDMSLPRGDTLGVSGAISVSAFAILGFVPSLAVTIVGSLGAWMLREKVREEQQPQVGTLAAIVGLFAVLALGQLVGPVRTDTQAWLLVVAQVTTFFICQVAAASAVSAIRTRRDYVRAIRGGLRMQMPLLLAQTSAALLLVIIYPTMSDWSLLPALALLLLIRQSYALLLGVRETYRATVDVIVRASDAEHVGGANQAHRTAGIAREIAEKCGVSSGSLEMVGYAALLRHVGRHAGEAGMPDERRASEIVGGIKFFEGVARVLAVYEGGPPSGGDTDALLAYIVALAGSIEAEERGGSAAAADDLRRLAAVAPSRQRARAVAAAIELGFPIPRLV